jgi:hypothetical protein
MTERFINAGKYVYFSVSVNPNNIYEICYVRRNSIGIKSDLCTYNFCKNKETVIAKDIDALSSTSWGVNGWILFMDINRHLYKIKSNADSLMQLTTTMSADARWAPKADKYFYSDVTASDLKLCNKDGTMLKSFRMPGSRWNWYDDNNLAGLLKVVSGNQYSVGLYNINTNQTNTIATIECGNPSGVSVHNGEILVSGREGLFSIKNNIATKIEHSYFSYQTIGAQALNDDYYIVNRVMHDSTGFDSCVIVQHIQVDIYNKKTGEERKVLLPE